MTQGVPGKILNLPNLAPSAFPAPPAMSTVGPCELLSQG